METTKNGRPTTTSKSPSSHQVGFDSADNDRMASTGMPKGSTRAGSKTRSAWRMRLPAHAQPGRRQMGVGIPGQKHRLEKHHAGAPDRGRAAEQRQDHPGDDRLDAKQEKCAEEERESENREHESLSHDDSHIRPCFRATTRPRRLKCSTRPAHQDAQPGCVDVAHTAGLRSARVS